MHGSEQVFVARGRQLAADGYTPLLAFLSDPAGDTDTSI